MADSVTVQALSYAADVLKFFAVPFGVMEILGAERRKKIEQAIVKRTKTTWRFAFYLSIPTFLGLHILAFSASHLVALFFAVIAGYCIFVVLAVLTDKIGALVTAGFLLNGAGYIIMIIAIISWLLPFSWLTAAFYPVEWGLALLRSFNTFWPPLVPAFDTRALISGYRDSVAAWQAYFISFGWVLKLATYLYFAVSDGLVVVVLLCLEAIFFLCIGATAWLILLAPFALFVLFSEQLKRRIEGSEKEALPLGALVIWGAGETLNMGVSTYKFWWTGG